MADFHVKMEAIAQTGMQFLFPQTAPVAIAPPTIGKDEKMIGIWIVF